jgi:hypothetical protein
MSTPVVCLSSTAWVPGQGRTFELMTRLGATRPVYVLEPPVGPCRMPLLGAARRGAVTVLTPYLPEGLPASRAHRITAPLVEAVLDADGVEAPIVWVAAPDRLPSADALAASAVVYDCPPADARRARPPAEPEALRRADVVFTASAGDAVRLRRRHPHVHHVPDARDPDRVLRAIADAVERTDDRDVPLHHYRVIAGGLAFARRHPRL